MMNSHSIGEVSQATGLSVHTLRYYERAGVLVDPPQRSSTGRRRYSDNDIEWLTVCSRLRETGMAIEDLSRYADLLRQGASTEAERLELLTQHRRKVTKQIDDLTRNLELIDLKIGAYRTNLKRPHGELSASSQARRELQPARTRRRS